MSSLGMSFMGLVNRLERVAASEPKEKLEESQRIIRASQGNGCINAGCRRFALMCLAQAVVSKDRQEVIA